MQVTVVSDADALLPHTAAWEALAHAAVEPNPFYEHWMLLSALRHLRSSEDVRCLLVFEDAPQPSDPPILCGVFPLRRHRRFLGLPIAGWSLWKYPHCYLTTPLVRAERAAECLRAVFEWLQSSAGACSVFELKHVHGDGPFHQLLADELTRTETIPILWECFTRAFFRPLESGDAYLAASLSGKSRSTLRRKLKQLSELGAVAFTSLGSGADLQASIEAFLRIEGSGWKGREGSALLCREPHRRFFTDAAVAAFSRNRLLMPAMLLGDKPIAQNSYFLSGRGAFFFKPAYDEEYSRFSPGLHLECENIRNLHTLKDIDWMDSCTAADNDMYKRLMPGRRTIQSLLIPTGRGLGPYAVSTIPLLRLLKRRLSGSRQKSATGPGEGGTDAA